MILELSPGEGGEGALVAKELLTLRVVLALLLELSVPGPHVKEEGLIPGGRVVTLITLQPPLLVPRPHVVVEVGLVVRPVLTVAAVEDLTAWMRLLEVNYTELMRRKLTLTERTLNGLL